jgi:hypothetical protein
LVSNRWDDPCGDPITNLWYQASNDRYYTSEFGSTLYNGYVYQFVGSAGDDYEWEYYEMIDGEAIGPFTTFSPCAPF